MDFNEIKKLISQTGGKYIIVERNMPEYVIMNFSEFCKILTSGGKHPELNSEARVDNNLEAINKDIAIMSGINNGNNSDPLDDSLDMKKENAGEIKIEDLPF